MNYRGTVAGSVLLAAITVNLQLGYCLNTETRCILPDERKQNIRNNSDFILGQLFTMDIALLFADLFFFFYLLEIVFITFCIHKLS